MARTNRPRPSIHTHTGTVAQHVNPELQLRRSVLACLLWEKTFYEDGENVPARIAALVPQVAAEKVAALAVEARSEMNLRHVPLLLAVEMAKHETHRHLVADTVATIVQRPDEITELLSLYALGRTGTKKLGKLSKQIQKGLARAFTKFDAYQLAKYDRAGEIRLRDALFLTHAKPKNEEQAAVWKQLVDGTLEAPDTWEVALSSGENKLDAWMRLLSDRKLGAMAILRNLRNMRQAGVGPHIIGAALNDANFSRVLPFRFIAAAKHAPELEPDLEAAMLQSLESVPKLRGRTALVVDHSDSMNYPLSERGQTTRFEAACGLAILLREIAETCSIVAFSAPIPSGYRWHDRIRNNDKPHVAVVPPRRGFALRDALEAATIWAGTNTQDGIEMAAKSPYDRIILLTDEQSHQKIHNPLRGTAAYCVNVATYENGIGYGDWTHIDGWSESVVRFIAAFEELA